MTVYATLRSTAKLTVKFRINPVSKFTVYWSMGDSVLQDINIINTINGDLVQTTYIILNVTNEQLGKYTIKVINWAINEENNEATFNIILTLTGNNSVLFLVCLNSSFCCD